ncbi:S-adenosyl-L-methionine-dependent methyltransferase [Xylaria palmicola]|nr:S-adenosyl-L-methionine-dependent methyltransferase [Xylaria palmicola]
MAKAQEELGKMFKKFGSDFDDERLDTFIADSYRVVRQPAALLLARVGLDESTSKPFTLLDHACGTGPIAAHLHAVVDRQVLEQSKMTCADLADNMVRALGRHAKKCGWANVETAVLDAQKSGLPESSFSHVTMNFAMHLVPDPPAVLQDVMRVLQPGGVFGFTVWHKDNSGWVPDMRSSFETLPFEAPMPDPLPMAPNGKFEFIDAGRIPEQLGRYGFEDIKVQTVEHVVRVESAEHYLRSYGMMKDWMTQAYWSEESKQKAKDMIDGHIIRHLTEKHNGQGWDLTWTLIIATCRKSRN